MKTGKKTQRKSVKESQFFEKMNNFERSQTRKRKKKDTNY